MKNFVRRILIFALFLLSLGGFLMHYLYHPLSRGVFAYVPLISGLISVIAIPLLFEFRKTLHLAYLLNGYTCIIGFITMAHFSLAKAPIIPDLIMVAAKFFVGWSIFAVTVYSLEGEARNTGWRTIRYPNLGFWFVHLLALSLVYWLGHTFWR